MGVGDTAEPHGTRNTRKARRPPSDCLLPTPSSVGDWRPEPFLERPLVPGLEKPRVPSPRPREYRLCTDSDRWWPEGCSLSPGRPEIKHSCARLLVAERGPRCHGHTPLDSRGPRPDEGKPCWNVVAGPGSQAASKTPGTARLES